MCVQSERFIGSNPFEIHGFMWTENISSNLIQSCTSPQWTVMSNAYKEYNSNFVFFIYIQINADTGERFTFEEMRLKTIRIAQNLQRRGFNSKCTIATVAGNVPHLAPVVFGNICLGFSVVSMYTAMEKHCVLRMFKITQPRIIFCEVKVYDLMVECLAEVGISNVKIFTFDGIKGDSEAVEDLLHATGEESDFV